MVISEVDNKKMKKKGWECVHLNTPHPWRYVKQLTNE